MQVLDEAKHSVTGGLTVGGLPVSHIAHLAGAVVGVLLVWLLRRVPESGDQDSHAAARPS
jgi:membrane associated rhomboid family serine protease